MSNTFRAAILCTFAPVALAACAGSDTRYPSLAVRDAERVSGELAPAPPAQPAALSEEASGSVKDAVAKAQSMHRKFLAAQPQAQQLAQAAKGQGIESNLRARALVAIADLTSLRTQTAVALGTLDQLEAEAASDLIAVAPINAAQTEVAEIMNTQDEALNALWSEMDR